MYRICGLLLVFFFLALQACSPPVVLKAEHFPDESEMTERALAIFLDGTANNPSSRTHVRQLFEMVSVRNHPAIATYYNNGVGGTFKERTGSVVSPGSTAAFGISKDIGQAFGFLAENYGKPLLARFNGVDIGKLSGPDLLRFRNACHRLESTKFEDTVYIFGFSRGAYTARSLIGLTNWYGGVPDLGKCSGNWADRDRIINEIYGLYRRYGLAKCYDNQPRQPDICRWLGNEKTRLIKRYQPKPVSFFFVGLWDTIRTIGEEALECAIDRRKPGKPGTVTKPHKFHRANSFANVDHAFHAMSLHERRDCYNLVRFDFGGGGSPPANHQEVWFAGDHSNIGGNTPGLRGFSGITMKWMMSELNIASQHASQAVPPQAVPLFPWFGDEFAEKFLYRDNQECLVDLSDNLPFKWFGEANRKPRRKDAGYAGDFIHETVWRFYGLEPGRASSVSLQKKTTTCAAQQPRTWEYCEWKRNPYGQTERQPYKLGGDLHQGMLNNAYRLERDARSSYHHFMCGQSK